MNELAPSNSDVSRIDTLIQFILAVAAEQDEYRDRHLGPIHFIKYVYLGDLAFAERNGGRTYTGTMWQFHHFGPWASSVMDRIEPALVVIGAERKQIASRYAADVVRYWLHGEEAERIRRRTEQVLPAEIQFSLSRAIQEHGSDTPSLLRAVYLSPPMLNAAPQERLDFATVVRESPAGYEMPKDESATKSQRRAQQRRLAEIRAEMQARLAGHPRPSVAEQPPPRYDDVFADGVRWLDSLAGESVREGEGTLTVSDDVWKSEARREPDIP